MSNRFNKQVLLAEDAFRWLRTSSLNSIAVLEEASLDQSEVFRWIIGNRNRAESEDLFEADLKENSGLIEAQDPLLWLLGRQQFIPDLFEDYNLERARRNRRLIEQEPIDAIAPTRTRLFTMTELNELKRTLNLSAAQWRQVGDNQKAMWRQRLLQRVGHMPAGSTVAPFEFNNADWQNIFQLEALVEFYMNFDDPWRPAPFVAGSNLPRLPFQADEITQTQGYIPVDLLARCHIVLVDSFGGRLSGTWASAAGNVVTLNDRPDLNKVNPNFDTIYLPLDTARASKTYRITAVNPAAFTVTIDGIPNLSFWTNWHIPAGLNGELPAKAYNLGPGRGRGFDHFDGVLFIREFK